MKIYEEVSAVIFELEWKLREFLKGDIREGTLKDFFEKMGWELMKAVYNLEHENKQLKERIKYLEEKVKYLKREVDELKKAYPDD